MRACMYVRLRESWRGPCSSWQAVLFACSSQCLRDGVCRASHVALHLHEFCARVRSCSFVVMGNVCVVCGTLCGHGACVCCVWHALWSWGMCVLCVARFVVMGHVCVVCGTLCGHGACVLYVARFVFAWWKRSNPLHCQHPRPGWACRITPVGWALVLALRDA